MTPELDHCAICGAKVAVDGPCACGSRSRCSAGVVEGLAELKSLPRDDWADAVLLSAAAQHATVDCVGYTTVTAGRALCALCGWQVSARCEDVGEKRSALFSLLALGQIGQAFALAVDVATDIVHANYGKLGVHDIRLDGVGGVIAIQDIALTRIIT